MGCKLELIAADERSRRAFFGNGKDLIVSVGVCTHERTRYGVMTRMVERGEVPRFMDETLTLTTHYTGDDSAYPYRYNPGIIPDGGLFGGPCVDAGWFMEPTADNVRRFLRAVEKLYDEEHGA